MSAHGHHGVEHTQVHVQPKDKAKIALIWKTAGILSVVTMIEFIAAGTLGRSPYLTALFVVLTFVKTFYIVGEFMHLKYEVKTLIWSIIIPTAFIMWLILAMLMEGHAIMVMRHWIFGAASHL